MSTPEEDFAMGKRQMGAQIAVTDCGGFASNFALGALEAICQYMIKRHGPRFTYDLLQNMADQAATSMIGQEPRR